MILDQNKVFADNVDKVKTLATELLKKMKDDTAVASDFSDFKAAVEKIFEVKPEVCFNCFIKCSYFHRSNRIF